MMKSLALLIWIFGIVFTPGISCGAIMVTTDVSVDISNRTNFVGFEDLGVHISGNERYYDQLSYTEDGVIVQQVGGDAGTNAIYASYFFPEGDLGWYPNGGDKGYTKITLGDGSDFDAIKFHRTSGGGASQLHYQLRKDDSVVLEGSVSHGKYLTQAVPRVFTPASLHFSGGGFDEIWLRDGSANASFGDDKLNTLAIDAIEVVSANNGASAAPEPSSLVMCGLATGGMAFGAYRRRRREQTAGAQ